MSRVLNLLLLVFCYRSWSETNAGIYRDILRARKAVTLQEIQERHENLNLARRACQIQLREKRLPSACYETLKRELSLGVHISAQKKKHWLGQLDLLCIKSCEDLRIPLFEGSDSYLSSVCQKQLKEARRVQKYHLDHGQDIWPEN